MPTFSTSLPPAAGPRHAAVRNRDRPGAWLTASWAALHLPVLALLGFSVHHEVEARLQASATAPDLPVS